MPGSGNGNEVGGRTRGVPGPLDDGLLEAVLDAAPEAIMAIDADGRIARWSAGAQRLYGYAGEEVVGQAASILVPPERLEEAARTAERVRGGSRVEMMRTARLRKGGIRIEVVETLLPLVGPNGGIVSIVHHTAASDDLRGALAREKQAAEELRVADEMKNVFLRAVSHDLRTPLCTIKGFADTLAELGDLLSHEQWREAATKISVHADRLDRMLSDLLDFDRLERGLGQVQRRPVNLGGLARRMAEEADVGDHPVTVEVPESVWPVDEPMVERIVENLLVNAARHTPAGTPIWLRMQFEDDELVIVVEDAGPGIDEDLKEVIFEPFRRGPDAGYARGTGVGLSLVASFAALHGGRAWIEDRPGGGASFHVLIPPPLAGDTL